MENESNKKRFCATSLAYSALYTALSTTDGDAPVYEKGIKFHQRTKEKKALRGILEEIEQVYIRDSVNENQHLEFIQATANEVSKALGSRLHNSRFRIGVAQKLINLHPKYRWVSGYVEESPHCQIDAIIRGKAKINYDGTKNDSIENYKQAVAELNKVANGRSLSAWDG